MTKSINGKTVVHGIMGNPVSHSLSPAMHNSAFADCGENRVYVPLQTEHVEDGLRGIKALNIGGVSVTIPHKEAVIPLLDEVDPVARNIGAVNTITVRKEGLKTLLCGFNTDWIGANRALSFHLELKGADLVLLGAGGAARAIGYGLQEAGATIRLCSRTESRGRALAEDLGCPWIPLAEAGSVAAKGLVNTTSVGMHPKEGASPVAKEVFSNFQGGMDIVYAPLQTRFLQDAREAGCLTINGLEMLLYQGVAQFELWTGKEAPVELMRKELMRATGNEKA